MPTQFIVYTPDLEQSGQHNTIQAHPETEISLWATLLNTLMRQADSAAHTGRGVGVTARYHNFILPLPAQLLTVIVTESDARTLHAGKHAQAYTQTYCTCNTHQNTQDWLKGGASTLLLDVTHCQVAGWVLSIELTKIKILATKKKKKEENLAMSLFRFESGSVKKCMMLKAVHRVSWACASVYTWFTWADTETRSWCQDTNVSTIQHATSDSRLLNAEARG